MKKPHGLPLAIALLAVSWIAGCAPFDISRVRQFSDPDDIIKLLCTVRLENFPPGDWDLDGYRAYFTPDLREKIHELHRQKRDFFRAFGDYDMGMTSLADYRQLSQPDIIMQCVTKPYNIKETLVSKDDSHRLYKITYQESTGKDASNTRLYSKEITMQMILSGQMWFVTDVHYGEPVSTMDASKAPIQNLADMLTFLNGELLRSGIWAAQHPRELILNGQNTPAPDSSGAQ